jgi:hypothetical protein
MAPPNKDFNETQAVTLKLLSYCQSRNWSGYDPYDALNSKIFKALPFLNSRMPRLILTQALKRSPVNLRPLFLIDGTQNPKGLALFLQAVMKLSKLGMMQRGDETIKSLAAGIEQLRSPNTPFWCWGYSFPWQTRTQLVPARSPNLVCTLFVAEALLDLFESKEDERYLQIAASAADYIAEDLYWTSENGVCSFSYPFPSSRTPVHNANLLAAAFLLRASRLTGNQKYLKPALNAARYSVQRQRPDGSWVYGESDKYAWVDNFHTGFNLCALRSIAQYRGESEFDESLLKGFKFYREHFFRHDGAPKYFHDGTYPIDVHSAAQSIITLLQLKDLDQTSETLALKVCNWTIANLWNDAGCFSYQKRSWGTIRIPYMRWGQAWMLLALATLLENSAGVTSHNSVSFAPRLSRVTERQSAHSTVLTVSSTVP